MPLEALFAPCTASRDTPTTERKKIAPATRASSSVKPRSGRGYGQ